jgi:putative alpha-1,2-mannosidase
LADLGDGGLQPVIGSDQFFVGSPMLERVQFNLDSGKTLLMTTENMTPTRM